MKILITGAGGFLGKGLVIPFEENDGYTLRLMDICNFDSKHEVVQADVSDYAQVAEAVKGMDAIIIAHMAPRGENSINYATPEIPFDINVKGTANLFHAAVTESIGKIVVISSGAAITGYELEEQNHTLRPKSAHKYYGMSKACQELIAEQFSREYDIQVACLRVGYILDGENNIDKYGNKVGERNYADTDRRDIGEVARLCLECKDLKYEALHVMSTEESKTRWDIQYTCNRLGWNPRYDFSWLREPTNK